MLNYEDAFMTSCWSSERSNPPDADRATRYRKLRRACPWVLIQGRGREVMTKMTYTHLLTLPPVAIVSVLALGIAFIGLHAALCRRNPVWLGAIVPVVYIAGVMSLSTAKQPTGGEVAGHVITLVALLAVWWAGEDARRHRRGEKT